MITILIADDDAAFRTALRTVLELEADFHVLAETADSKAAFALALQLLPDVVLADISLPGLSSIEFAESLRECLPSTCFTVLGDHAAPDLIAGTLRAGAKAYVNKLWVDAGLPAVIRDVVKRREPIRMAFGAGQYSQPMHLASPCNPA